MTTSIFNQWIFPLLTSQLLLGFYDITKKHAVRDNPVMPVLFFATLIGSVFFLLYTLITGTFSEHFLNISALFIPVLVKSAFVSAAWFFIFYAMRELPISIAAPIGASSPLWVFIGGLILFREIPSLRQAAAMLLIFGGYYLFSVFGKLEGISFCKCKGIHFMLLGTLFNAASALCDKYILSVMKLPPKGVQFWFSIDLAVILGIAYLIQIKTAKHTQKFIFRWSVPMTGILLILADIFYFYSLTLPDTPISIMSLIRRSSCIVSFVLGGIWFHEKNKKKKFFALILILIGVVMLALKK